MHDPTTNQRNTRHPAFSSPSSERGSCMSHAGGGPTQEDDMHNVKVTFGKPEELKPLEYELNDYSQNPFPACIGAMLFAIASVGGLLWLSSQAAKWLMSMLLLAVVCLPVSAAGDYNFNGVIDCQDCEILQFATGVWTEAFIGGDPDPEGAAESAVLSEYGYSHLFDDFDLTGDGFLVWDVMQNPSITSDSDRLVLLESNTFYGDANLDGRVSLIDLDILGQNFGQPGGWCEGDFNGDGQVSLIDLDILGRFYGSGT